MSKTQKLYRQGDVLLVGIAVKRSELEDAPKDARGLVLAEGESSGHYHAVFGPGAKLCRYKAEPHRVVVVADKGGDVRVIGGGSGGVDRHTPIRLTPGLYEVRTQRCFDSGYSRRVAD